MRVLRREGHGARSAVHRCACPARMPSGSRHYRAARDRQEAAWLYPVRLRRGWCRLAAGDIGSGCSEESASDWSSRLAGLTRRLPLIDAGVGECGIAASSCTDPASRSPQCFQGSHDRGPEYPPGIPGRADSAPRHRGRYQLLPGRGGGTVHAGRCRHPGGLGTCCSGPCPLRAACWRPWCPRTSTLTIPDSPNVLVPRRLLWCGYTKPTPRWPKAPNPES